MGIANTRGPVVTATVKNKSTIHYTKKIYIKQKNTNEKGNVHSIVRFFI
jgi:putative NADH-flavin reductase